MSAENGAIEEAEVVGQEIVHYTEPPTALFKTDDPVEVIEKATAVANALKGVLTSQGLTQVIQGKDYVKIEGWQTLGAMLGVTAVCVSTEPVDGGYRATVEARMPDGRVVGRADALCTKHEKRGPWKAAEDYARLSMAQTRATSKALKGPLGFVVALAGYATTPAEEMAGAVGPVESTVEPEAEGEPMTAAQRKGVIKAIEASDNPVDLVLRAVGLDSPDGLMTHHWPQIETLIGASA